MSKKFEEQVKNGEFVDSRLKRLFVITRLSAIIVLLFVFIFIGLFVRTIFITPSRGELLSLGVLLISFLSGFLILWWRSCETKPLRATGQGVFVKNRGWFTGQVFFPWEQVEGITQRNLGLGYPRAYYFGFGVSGKVAIFAKQVSHSQIIADFEGFKTFLQEIGKADKIILEL